MKAKRLLFVLSLLVIFCYSFAIPKLVGTFAQAGHSDWNTADSTLNMVSVNDTLFQKAVVCPAGTYAYKVLDGTAWTDPNYPTNNQTFDLESQTTMIWYCNNVAHLVMHTNPTVAGNFLSLVGGVNWDPTNIVGDMTPLPTAYPTYQWQMVIPAGTYEFKVTLNHNWDQNTTTNNIPFVSDGITPTLITYYFRNNVVTTSAGAPPSATIKFIVDDSAGQTHTAFYLKGSWNGNGNYDPTWGNGMEHVTLLDDGTNGDVTAGDHIFTAVQDLVTDAGSNTWSWGVNDETHTWVDNTYPTFTLPTADPQTLSATILGGTTQVVSVTFTVNMSAADPLIYAGGVSVQGDVLPLDWTNGSHIMAFDGTNYTTAIAFPVGSPRIVHYKYGAFDALNNWAWESFEGNHTFTINDSFLTQVLPIIDFAPISNNDQTASMPSLKICNYPNPFANCTTLTFNIVKRGLTSVAVYNLRGQLVRSLVNETMEKGEFTTKWDAKDNDGKGVASGVYVYKVNNNGLMAGKKVILLK